MPKVNTFVQRKLNTENENEIDSVGNAHKLRLCFLKARNHTLGKCAISEIIKENIMRY